MWHSISRFLSRYRLFVWWQCRCRLNLSGFPEMIWHGPSENNFAKSEIIERSIRCSSLAYRLFKNRKQAVLINKVTSTYLDATSGVPQGSVLEPLLFSIFMNNISAVIRSNINLYAHYCVLYSGIKSEADCLMQQGDIDRISRWCAQ